ncbi:MAG: hypothetical protein IPJ75_03835 [Ignavibacteriales bacterium]|nr:hypothetical protein [Ignavibacteriales bacterium]
MKFDSVSAVFSRVFMISGMIESNNWAAGQLSASRIVDFQAGKVGSC